MEESKKQRFTPKNIKIKKRDENLIYCCYCPESIAESTNDKKKFFHGFNSRLYFFLRSIGISEEKLLCCKACFMEVDKNDLEKNWILEKLSLKYKGVYENTYKCIEYDNKKINIIGDYCLLVDQNKDNHKQYIIISISDDLKTFVINRIPKNHIINY